MYVCVCNSVTDREIKSAVEFGARSFKDIQASLGVATCCRRCTDCASKVVAAALACTSCPAGYGDD
jgi:bacterioferritin-associated ferredoxin